MSTSVIEMLSAEQARERYENLKRSIIDFEDFKRRGSCYELEADEAALYDKISDLEFLLERG